MLQTYQMFPTSLSSTPSSYWNVFKTPCSVAWKRLAAPKLRCLIIDFSTEDQHDQDPDACDSEVKDWLIGFAKGWKLTNSQSSLEEINIDHEPGMPWSYESEREGPWPWRYMTTARDRMKTYDLNLTWPDDDLDEQDWRDTMRKREAAMIFYQSDAEQDEEREDEGSLSESDGPFYDLFQQEHDPSQHRLCRMFATEVHCVH